MQQLMECGSGGMRQYHLLQTPLHTVWECANVTNNYEAVGEGSANWDVQVHTTTWN